MTLGFGFWFTAGMGFAAGAIFITLLIVLFASAVSLLVPSKKNTPSKKNS